LLKLLFASFLFFTSSSTWAGSCCGGGAGSTQLMLGTTKAVFRSQYQDKTILADSDLATKIQPRSDLLIETIRTLNNSFSYRTSYLSQVGLNVPVVEKIRNINSEWQSAQGLGDVQLNAGYEFYPEYNRHQFITQAFAFFQVTIPTAPSLFTTKRTDLLDTRGQGHYLYTPGILLLKRVGFHTFNFQGSLTYRPATHFQGGQLTQNSVTTESSLDHALSLSHSYSVNNQWSSMLTISRTYTQNKSTSLFIGKTQSSLVYPLSIGAIYTTDNYDFTASYQDDFLIGPSYNQILGRAVSVGLIKRLSL
jgi:hypothetical protein